MIVEVWLNDFPVRIMTAYGPQLGDLNERKNQSFGNLLKKKLTLLIKLVQVLSYRWTEIVISEKISLRMMQMKRMQMGNYLLNFLIECQTCV